MERVYEEGGALEKIRQWRGWAYWRGWSIDGWSIAIGVIMVGVTGLGCKGVTRGRAGLRMVGVD